VARKEGGVSEPHWTPTHVEISRQAIQECILTGGNEKVGAFFRGLLGQFWEICRYLPRTVVMITKEDFDELVRKANELHR
jgi:hypothetical protein